MAVYKQLYQTKQNLKKIIKYGKMLQKLADGTLNTKKHKYTKNISEKQRERKKYI